MNDQAIYFPDHHGTPAEPQPRPRPLRFLPLVLLALTLCLARPAAAQQAEWGIDAMGFFDNSEGSHTLRRTQTYAGMSTSPEAGISWNQRQHKVALGVNMITRWGADDEDDFRTKALLYYHYDSPRFAFIIGNFMRDKLLGDYPEYLLADTIRYFRPVVQGMAYQYKNPYGHFEAFLDWTSAISHKSREQFMAGVSTKFRFHRFQLGAEGYYYHYALRYGGPDSEHIHDYLIAHPFVGFCADRSGVLDSLEVRTGLLVGLDRERSVGNGWHTPLGFMGEIIAAYRHLTLRQTVYAGGNMQPYGAAHLGQYYWGDTYTQAPFYSRTDLTYRFISNRFANVYAGVIVNASRYGLNHHQVVTLRLNLDSSDFKPLKFW